MIYCIGNSHVAYFAGTEKRSYFPKKENESFNELIGDDRFKLLDLGGIIAYNFIDSHMNKVYDIIKNIDYISLIAGEVDCRLHLPSQADKQNKSDEETVNECAERFFICYDKLIEMGYKVFCISTHPTTTEGHSMQDMSRPIYGNVERRNNICVLWNRKLEELSLIRNIPFITIYNNLVDENNITKMEYFSDYCHLNSSKVINFYLDELKKYDII